MLSTLLAAALLAQSSLGALIAPLQEVLDVSHSKKTDLIYELKKAEIIPTVLDTFHRQLSVHITWPNTTAHLGNTIAPSAVQDTPAIQLISLPNAEADSLNHVQLTLALTDPDAPSRDNPEWSEICHWIVTSVPLTTTTTLSSTDNDLGDMTFLREIMPYKPPGPPEKTGKHRYIFVALAPLNGTSERLDLRKPKGRKHWGFEKERQGLRMWAEEMGLGVVGANFIYSQNDEQ